VLTLAGGFIDLRTAKAAASPGKKYRQAQQQIEDHSCKEQKSNCALVVDVYVD